MAAITIRRQAALRRWTDLLVGQAIELIRASPDDVERAAGTAMQLEHRVKNNMYPLPAIDRQCDQATCDREFAERARSLYSQVRLLTDVNPLR